MEDNSAWNDIDETTLMDLGDLFSNSEYDKILFPRSENGDSFDSSTITDTSDLHEFELKKRKPNPTSIYKKKIDVDISSPDYISVTVHWAKDGIIVKTETKKLPFLVLAVNENIVEVSIYSTKRSSKLLPYSLLIFVGQCYRLYSFKTNEERLLYISNLVDIAVFGLSNIGVFRPQATSTDTSDFRKYASLVNHYSELYRNEKSCSNELEN